MVADVVGRPGRRSSTTIDRARATCCGSYADMSQRAGAARLSRRESTLRDGLRRLLDVVSRAAGNRRSELLEQEVVHNWALAPGLVRDRARPLIPVARPWLDEREAEAARRAILSGWVTQGPEVAAFEREFAAAVGAPHACAVSSCTTALHLALLAARRRRPATRS